MSEHPTLALRSALLWCVVPALVLAVLQAAVAGMAWPSADRVWPGIVSMLVAQAVLLVGAAACVVGFVRLSRTTEPEAALRGTASALAPLPWILLGLLVATALAWLVIDANAAIGAVVFGLVGAQAWFALTAARRSLLRGLAASSGA
ncbi:MAG: hypothetical protein Q4G64_03450 [bacterium]|nr:hypothetical protein [bacterium]